MKKQIMGLFFVASMMLISVTASAATIVGDIHFAGTGDILDDNNTLTTDLNLAAILDFDPNTILVLSATDDFAAEGISAGDTGTIQDVDLSLTSIVDLWTVDIFSFDLDTYTTTINSAGTLLTLEGSGILSALNYDDTFATFLLTVNSATSEVTFSFSSNTTAVPVPAALWLFGSAMVGLVAVGRRKLTSEDSIA